jgi:hypothetical protein
MEKVTLKVNMIVGGRHFPRGSVVSRELLPNRLRTGKYIVPGVVSINKVMPIDMIEVGDDIEIVEEDESPMRELTMEEVQPSISRLKKRLR